MWAGSSNGNAMNHSFLWDGKNHLLLFLLFHRICSLIREWRTQHIHGRNIRTWLRCACKFERCGLWSIWNMMPMLNCFNGWLVVWNMFFFPIYWECHHPNWLPYFFRGVAQPPTRWQLCRILVARGTTPVSSTYAYTCPPSAHFHGRFGNIQYNTTQNNTIQIQMQIRIQMQMPVQIPIQYNTVIHIYIYVYIYIHIYIYMCICIYIYMVYLLRFPPPFFLTRTSQESEHTGSKKEEEIFEEEEAELPELWLGWSWCWSFRTGLRLRCG